MIVIRAKAFPDEFVIHPLIYQRFCYTYVLKQHVFVVRRAFYGSIIKTKTMRIKANPRISLKDYEAEFGCCQKTAVNYRKRDLETIRKMINPFAEFLTLGHWMRLYSQPPEKYQDLVENQ
jgi:hypothetical protein